MIGRKLIIRIILLCFPTLLLIYGMLVAGNTKTGKTVDNTSNKFFVPSISLGENVSSGESDNYRIDWQVMPGAVGTGSSTSYGSSITVGQTSTGAGESESYKSSTGYYEISASPCDCESGEADGISPINILDVVYLINFKYKSGPAPSPYALCNGDADCDCAVNILDVVYIINFKYKSGPAPCDCATWTGICGSLRK